MSALKNLFRKKSFHSITQSNHLSRHLGVKDLTALGIAAIIGAGIFSTIGKASASGGPGVILLFLFVALACSFTAFAYAEFASIVPVSGSAYTYSYMVFGELFAWLIGWSLIMEYAIGNVTVALSWSEYFTHLINHQTPFHIPEWLCVDYFSAKAAYFNTPSKQNTEAWLAYAQAPELWGQKIIFDAPALFVNFLITLLVYRGIKESRNASNIMVLIKIAVVVLVIMVGAGYVSLDHWKPFLPNGINGLTGSISAVFFAYIGFDAISTTAEECHNPQKDLPRGIFYALFICTVLYILVALVLTGMVSYTELNVGDPLAYVFDRFPELQWLGGIISISAVVAMASVMLVFQIGQPRIWYSMSRDGLLPKAFQKIHPRYKTPSFSTLVTGILVAIPIFLVDITMVTDICSAGTLFAFCLVCAGILKLSCDPHRPKSAFKTPYLNSRFVLPLLLIIGIAFTYFYNPDFLHKCFNKPLDWQGIPMFIFWGIGTCIVLMAMWYEFSVIPTMGLLLCFYMLSELGLKNWLYFSSWLVVGLIIYFSYGYHHSALKKSLSES